MPSRLYDWLDEWFYGPEPEPESDMESNLDSPEPPRPEISQPPPQWGEGWKIIEAPRWLDAPTCEGWWWFKGDIGEQSQIVRVSMNIEDESFTAKRFNQGYLECGAPVSHLGGRWFGPLVPPEW